jgi:two-component system, OmpR family, sensor histidine kinase MtrB
VSTLALQKTSLRGYWRRNLQLRLIIVTFVISTSILGGVGVLLINQVTSGLLEAKQQSVLTESTAARLEVQRLLDASDIGLVAPNNTRLVDSVITALAVRAGSPGLYDALFLSDPDLVGVPERGTKLISELSIPDELRTAIRERDRQAWAYSTLVYQNGAKTQGLVVGSPVSIPRIGAYELYLLFPLDNEQRTIDLVRQGVAATGIILLISLMVLAWFVTSRVTAPVREAAEIAVQIASGDLDRRMQVSGEDDIARLAGSFNEMATSLQSQIIRLESLSQVQQQFVSDVSHELRTPLTTVRMASEMIYNARANFDPDMARSAELLRNQVDRFDLLLSDLLEMSKIDAGAAPLESAPVDLAMITEAILKDNAVIAAEHATSFEFRSSGDAIVIADKRRVSRIIRNLVVNAIEHCNETKVEIEIAANESCVSISVRDHGQGIAVEDLSRVFGRFWRADPARQRTLGGTGLGLSISAEDAALHGGIIEVWGAPNEGAQFVLTLPRVELGPLTGVAISAGAP